MASLGQDHIYYLICDKNLRKETFTADEPIVLPVQDATTKHSHINCQQMQRLLWQKMPNVTINRTCTRYYNRMTSCTMNKNCNSRLSTYLPWLNSTCYMTWAESPGSHINTSLSWGSLLANSGWTFWYSCLMKAAALSVRSASTRARQQPLNPAPLKRAPKTPGAFRRIS